MPKTFSSWLTKDKIDKFVQHCEQYHAGQVLFSMHTKECTFIESDPYYLKDRIQWSLVQAIRREPFPIGYIEALLEGDGYYFRWHLASIFGYAQAVNSNKDQLRKVKPHLLLKGVGPLYDMFISRVAILLTSIEEACTTFDFRGYGETLPHTSHGPRHLLLWNWINLFFYRGLHVDPPYLFITDVDIPDLTIHTISDTGPESI